MTRTKTLLAALVGALGVAVLVGSAPPVTASPGAAAAAPPISGYVPPVRHVFVVNIENKGYDETWGAGSKAPYLARTLRAKGVLLNTYYGTAHNSQPNYVAQISGQGPDKQMQADCQIFSDFHQVGTVAPQQAVGTGCVFPKAVPTLAGQLAARSISWKGYMQDMQTPCRHPALNTQDQTQKARKGDQYAARHNPFVYFHSIIDRTAYCRAHVVPLSNLQHDLGAIATTPRLTYITPNLCFDGHDSPCVDGKPGGLASVNTWMKTWVPRILSSPAYRQDGMLVITADESDGPHSDASACCGEGPGPNTPLPGITGLGGGKIGALVISKWTRGGTWSTTPYNHYSLLGSIEDVFRVPHLGYASPGKLHRFGLDVYNNGWNN